MNKLYEYWVGKDRTEVILKARIEALHAAVETHGDGDTSRSVMRRADQYFDWLMADIPR